MKKLWEQWYPWVFGFSSCSFLYSLKVTPKVSGYEKVLDGVITFSSIIIGFLAALLAIILSLSKSEVIKHLYSHVDENNGKNLLFKYFRQSIFSGFFVVVFSIFMYVLKDKFPYPFGYGKYIFYLWAFITSFAVTSSFRIITILMKALFIELTISHTPQYEQKSKITEDQIKELKKNSTRES